MSWSIQKTIGKPAAVRPGVEADFDRAAKQYAGQTEEKDVLAAKAAMLSWLDESSCSETEGVEVEANGSRCAGWLNVTVKCAKVRLVLA